jgi:hypothetical protein
MTRPRTASPPAQAGLRHRAIGLPLPRRARSHVVIIDRDLDAAHKTGSGR